MAKGQTLIGRFIAGTIAAAFFAALPLWFLSKQEGRLTIRCGGTPWRCTVRRSWVFWHRTETWQPSAISVAEHRVSYDGRSSPAWQLVFTQGSGRFELLASPTTRREIREQAADLERARVAGETVQRELPADFAYLLALGLVVLFAAAGYFIVFATRA